MSGRRDRSRPQKKIKGSQKNTQNTQEKTSGKDWGALWEKERTRDTRNQGTVKEGFCYGGPSVGCIKVWIERKTKWEAVPKKKNNQQRTRKGGKTFRRGGKGGRDLRSKTEKRGNMSGNERRGLTKTINGQLQKEKQREGSLCTALKKKEVCL